MTPLVLIVEDEADMRATVRGLLDDEHYQTMTASTLADARRKLFHDPVEVLVLDLGLPDGDATTLLDELIARKSKVVVVIVSAAPQASRIAMRYAVTFVAKPFEVEVLKAAVEVAIERGVHPRLPV